MICNPPESIYCGHCPDCLTDQRERRIFRLMAYPSLMTKRAAATVVDAAMFGIGCTEGRVRATIEAQKQQKARQDASNTESNSSPV